MREWVKPAERDPGTRQDGGFTTVERQELADLWRENGSLREDVGFDGELRRRMSVNPDVVQVFG